MATIESEGLKGFTREDIDEQIAQCRKDIDGFIRQIKDLEGRLRQTEGILSYVTYVSKNFELPSRTKPELDPVEPESTNKLAF